MNWGGSGERGMGRGGELGRERQIVKYSIKIVKPDIARRTGSV